MAINASKSIPLESKTTIATIVTGKENGVYGISRYYAKMRKLNLEVFYPVYKKYGKRAPLIRNKEIIKNCDGLLAIWDGESNGTAYTINKAKKENKKLLKPTMMMSGTFQNKDDQEKR